MSIINVIGMIPKGGKYAKSVVNFVRKAPEHWPKFKEAIKQIDDLLKIGKLKLDGKQKTIFETNKNILKNHEKVTKKVEVPPSVTKKYPPFNVSKEDFTKGWIPTLHERSSLRNIYKDKLHPPASKYTKEMEAIDEELDALAFGGEKYEGLSSVEKAAIFKKLQAEMDKLIKVAMKEDLSTLSLSQINKKSQNLQKRIREIADNPDIKGTVYEGPKRDMIKALYDSEHTALRNARKVITKRNSELKYGKKYPVLDPENDAFIITGLDDLGNPNKMSRFTGKFSATKDKTTGELTSGEGTSFYDKWNAETNQMRKKGEEVFHETLNNEGKVIMSNPEYKLPKTGNMELQTEFYTDLSTSDLAKKGYELKQIDMIIKGREARKYLEKTKNPDVNISMHEQTSTNEIGAVMEDLYNQGDDIYKMTMKEWVTKIPEHFAEGGRTGFHRGSLRHQKTHDYRAYEKSGDWLRQSPPENWLTTLLGQKKMGYNEQRDAMESFMKERFMYGEKKQPLTNLGKSKLDKKINTWIKELFTKNKRNEHATGGISNLFQERQGYRSGELITGGIKLVKGARWIIKQLKSILDDMIYGSGDVKSIFNKMPEAEKIKHFKQTEAAIKQLESGGPIPDELLTTFRQDARFKGLTVSKTGDKDFIEIQEVVLGKLPKGKGEIIEGKAVEEIGTGEKLLKGTVVDEKVELFAFMNELPKELQHKVGLLPVEQQIPLLKKFKEAVDAVKAGGTEKGLNVLQKQLLEDFIPKGKGNAEGGLISGYATGGVSNLFRQRQGFRTGNIAKLPEFIKFVEGLLIKASNQIRQGLGKWKGLDWKQKMAQHDNLTKLATEFQKTKKFDVRINEYVGIDAEKAFIEAQAKVKKTVPEVSGDTYLEALDKRIMKEMEITKSEMDNMSSTALDDLRRMADPIGMEQNLGEITSGRGVGDFADDPNFLRDVTPVKTKKTRTMDDLVEDAYQEVFYQKPSSGDYKYDADVLAEEIASQGGKIYDDLAAVEKAGIYDLAYKRVIKDLKFNMDRNKILKDVEQKMKLSDFDTTGKKGNAEGGLIPGYATGGVSNLFRSR